MLCEDEFIVAMDLKLQLEDVGFVVLGPFAKTSEGLAAIKDQVPDLAVLDVNLRDGQVFPVADALSKLGVHMVFHSGHVDEDEIRDEYPEAIFCPKPASSARLQEALNGLAATTS